MILPDTAYAVRDKNYKLIRQIATNYDPQNPSLGQACMTVETDEFYAIDQKAGAPTLDHPNGAKANNLLVAGTAPGSGGAQLSGVSKKSYQTLDKDLIATLKSFKPCPGDVNLDAKIDEVDLADQLAWIEKTNGTSTWWDLDLDGDTDATDIAALEDLAMQETCGLNARQTR